MGPRSRFGKGIALRDVLDLLFAPQDTTTATATTNMPSGRIDRPARTKNLLSRLRRSNSDRIRGLPMRRFDHLPRSWRSSIPSLDALDLATENGPHFASTLTRLLLDCGSDCVSATERVFDITELAEMCFVAIEGEGYHGATIKDDPIFPAIQLFPLRGVNQSWRAVIDGSVKLRRHMGLVQGEGLRLDDMRQCHDHFLSYTDPDCDGKLNQAKSLPSFRVSTELEPAVVTSSETGLLRHFRAVQRTLLTVHLLPL